MDDHYTEIVGKDNHPSSSTKKKHKYIKHQYQKHRKHQCSICKRQFRAPSHLSSHMRVHKKPDHKCSHCGKQFTLKDYMDIHTRTHTGEKPYACDVCGMKFTLSSNRDRHVKQCRRKTTTEKMNQH